MDGQKKPHRLRWIGVLVAAAIAFAVVLSVGGNDDPQPAAAQNEVTYNIIDAGAGCDKQRVVERALYNLGFDQGQYVIGEDQINWAAAEANERGDGAFAQETATSVEAHVAQLGDGSEASNAAVNHHSAKSGAPVPVLLNAGNWTPVQFNIETELSGNTAFVNGEVVSAGTRQSQVGEVVWMFVNPEKCMQVSASEGDGGIPAEEAVTAHRAGCSNPQDALPKPKVPPPPKEERPPPPQVPPPTVPPTQPPTTQKCTGPGGDRTGGRGCGDHTTGPEQQGPHPTLAPEYPEPPEPPPQVTVAPRPPGTAPPPPPEVPKVTVTTAPGSTQPPPPPPGGNR